MIIKNDVASDTFIQLNDGLVTLASGPNSVSVSREGANFMNGPVSISSPFTKVRMGGIYKFNSLMAATMPSTMITPVPTLEVDLPVKNAASLAAITGMILSTVI